LRREGWRRRAITACRSQSSSNSASQQMRARLRIRPFGAPSLDPCRAQERNRPLPCAGRFLPPPIGSCGPMAVAREVTGLANRPDSAPRYERRQLLPQQLFNPTPPTGPLPILFRTTPCRVAPACHHRPAGGCASERSARSCGGRGGGGPEFSGRFAGLRPRRAEWEPSLGPVPDPGRALAVFWLKADLPARNQAADLPFLRSGEDLKPGFRFRFLGPGPKCLPPCRLSLALKRGP